MRILLVVNPASGPEARGLARQARGAAAARWLRDAGATSVDIVETRGVGDGRTATQHALGAGVDRVVVWGGDGTLNEVAHVLLGSSTPMAIIPGGSGNGLARGLGVPLRSQVAAALAVTGRARLIDTGVCTSGAHAAGAAEGDPHARGFLNVAGVGFDALVARRVNTDNTRRGLPPYLAAMFREWRTFEPQSFTLATDDGPAQAFTGHFVAVCNGQQYGHDTRVAPHALFDDGWLDVVGVPPITTGRLIRHGWRLFHGSLPRVPGVITRRSRQTTVTSARPLHVHLDGELLAPRTAWTFAIRPASLWVVGAVEPRRVR